MTYRALFDAAIGQSPPSSVDIDAIIRRQRRRRRVIGRAAVIGVAVSMAAGLLASGYLLGDGRPERPDVTATVPAGPLPEYVDGRRIIAQASAPLAERTVTLTFTSEFPQTELTIYAYCDIVDRDPVVEMEVRFEVGVWYLNERCGTKSIMPSPGWPPFARVGEPSSMTLVLTGGLSDPLPPGTLAVAVGEPVPPEEYPFPRRPPTLAPLAEVSAPPPEPSGERVEFPADPDDPAAPRRSSLVWGELTVVFLRAQTPGSVRVEVDGHPLTRVNVWSYDQTTAAVDLAASRWWDGTGVPKPEPGDEVTVTLVPEEMVGEWSAVVVTDPVSE